MHLKQLDKNLGTTFFEKIFEKTFENRFCLKDSGQTRQFIYKLFRKKILLKVVILNTKANYKNLLLKKIHDFRSSRYENSVNHMTETYVSIKQQYSCVILKTTENILQCNIAFCKGITQIQENLPYLNCQLRK